MQVVDAGKDLNSYAKVESGAACCTPAAGSCCVPAPELHDVMKHFLECYDVNAFAARVRVFAVKPLTGQTTTIPSQETTMTTLQVFDKPMCCSTGVCGPSVDPVLPKFAADLAWLQEQGVTVERYNLAHQPQAFVAHPDVTAAIREGNEQVLPMVRLGGVIVSKGAYPSREQLAGWCEVGAAKPLAVTEPAAAGSCCGPTGCC